MWPDVRAPGRRLLAARGLALCAVARFVCRLSEGQSRRLATLDHLPRVLVMRPDSAIRFDTVLIRIDTVIVKSNVKSKGGGVICRDFSPPSPSGKRSRRGGTGEGGTYAPQMAAATQARSRGPCPHSTPLLVTLRGTASGTARVPGVIITNSFQSVQHDLFADSQRVSTRTSLWKPRVYSVDTLRG